MAYDAFISYRRSKGFEMANIIRDRLHQKGLSCFLDLEEDRSGKFDERLLQEIQAAPNFILILTEDTLERCVNEDDWVRKEILEAIHNEKNIIPLMYSDFKWSEALRKQLPDEISSLQWQQGVLISQEYLSSTLDKLINYMVDIENPSEATQTIYDIPLKTEDFFCWAFKNINNIQSVDMAFHAGSAWHYDSKLVEILQEIIDRNIKLRIIINKEKMIKDIAIHRQQSLKKYYGYNKSIEDWLEKERLYPDVVNVKIATVPLMHRYYLVKGNGEGVAKVSFYTYGNPFSEQDFQYAFHSSTQGYQLYEQEFEYIWNKASKKILMDEI
ncbi:MAG: toll/interleukin-1 receptor domain-containing protein [Oscillospiraceae bacterium]|nr:toll/interleukin-1 receptor domain-containing protein [Oscillospiraceae bacterium]